jgi:hypothetical protein
MQITAKSVQSVHYDAEDIECPFQLLNVKQ